MERRWFQRLFDVAPDVYFRYRFKPTRGFDYINTAVESLTGFASGDYVRDPAFCIRLIAPEDRRVLRQVLRARKGLTTTLRVCRRDGTTVTVDLRTVPIIRGRDVVAIEGMVRLRGAVQTRGEPESSEPVPQRLAALLCEVHDLLHGHPELRRAARADATAARATSLTAGPIAFDTESLTVALNDKPIALTTKEARMLRYLLEHRGRVVSRDQLLRDVWGNRYTADARTVDVHVSRLRRKLPPLKQLLATVKDEGYRLDAPPPGAVDVAS